MTERFKTTTGVHPMVNKGFQIIFENGCTVSIQFGNSTYSDQGKTTAEVGVWDKEGKWIHLQQHDAVQGWCSPEEVLSIMNKVANNEFSHVGDDVFLS